ncbi:TetR/AcrR family transcriptional regulator [Paracoccus sp. Z330]|uniref:TetR/AcrR family transcriptional regulator n=1 Tax=Paracoccus onchidii TaxID=3017813 RepID=A0ABT4ZAE9_9RHOB|nr:TetR/AcrR family transcriptional regulator [Paracoccus onchidii]MDB6176324.1 TetR/AcrR family transcriptional regulator [Paracoccus onchidii]
MKPSEKLVRSRGRPPCADATRRIVEAATCLFLAKGYGATTMQDVARKFGGSKQTIYARFPDKHALAEAVVTAFTERRLQVPRQIASTPGPARETLTKLAAALLESALQRETIMMLRLIVSESNGGPELSEIMHQKSRLPGFEMMTLAMERLTAEGQLVGKPEDLAQMFFDLVLVHRVWDAMFDPNAMQITPEMLAKQRNAVDFFLRAASVTSEGRPDLQPDAG